MTASLTKFVALSTGLWTSAMFALHYKFGMRLRHNFNIPECPKTMKDDSLPSDFSVFSQNIWCSFVYGGKCRKQRLKLLIDKIGQDAPDIVCFQELFIFRLGPFLICGDFDYLHDAMLDLGYKYYSDPTQTLPSLWGGNNGLAIYSKYKMESCESYAFDLSMRRRFSAKGWISATIDGISIVNTHLEHANRDYKLKQMEVIKENLKNDNSKYKICLGDFNVCSRHTWEDKFSSPHRLYDILSMGMNDIGLKHDLFNSDTFERTFRATEKEPNAVYDHVFVNQHLKDMVVNVNLMDYSDEKSDLVMSDHYGLMTRFQKR